MFKPRRIPGLEDELNQQLMNELLVQRGSEIREAWVPEIEAVRQAIRDNDHNSINRIADNVGHRLKIPMDSGGTDAGARGRQVVLNVLAEILNEDE